MTSKKNWENKVYNLFLGFLESKKQRIKEIFSWEKIQRENPFGTSLINDSDFWKACKIERSFVTTLGQSVYENIALVISRDLCGEAEKGFTYVSRINKRVNKKINSIIKELNEGNRVPNWAEEIEAVKQIRDPNKTELIDLKITLDLFVPNFKNNEPFYAEIKSPKPNKDQCLQTKQKLLKVYFSEDWIGENVYLAFPYNPYLTRENYNHPHIKSTFKIPDSPKLIMGKEFWDLIGGEGAFLKILELAKLASKNVNILDFNNSGFTQKKIDNFD